MKISVAQYARGLWEMTAEKSATEVKKILPRFAAVLAQHSDLGKGEAIIAAFLELWNREHGELEATLVSARKTLPATRTAVLTYLAGKTGAQKITLQEEIDEKLIGGFVLRYQDRILDASLRNGLTEIHRKISG